MGLWNLLVERNSELGVYMSLREDDKSFEVWTLNDRDYQSHEHRFYSRFPFLMNKEKYIKKKEALQGSTPTYIGGIQKREKKPLTRA